MESRKKSLFGLRIPERSIMVHHGKGSQQRAKIRWQEWKAEALHPSCEDKAETTNWKGLEVFNLKSSPTHRGVLFPYQGSTASNLPPSSVTIWGPDIQMLKLWGTFLIPTTAVLPPQRSDLISIISQLSR